MARGGRRERHCMAVGVCLLAACTEYRHGSEQGAQLSVAAVLWYS